MGKLSSITVIIPAYKPDENLPSVIEGLKETGFTDFIIVNDGSGPDYSEIFENVGNIPGCTLLEHEVNRGKGAALKTAFSYCVEKRRSVRGVVTADADGQHRPEDISGCVEDMLESGDIVLGCRDFNTPGIPKRSVFGNKVSSKLYKLFYGLDLGDTQTGLRAIPQKYIKYLSEIPGDRYEYESNMLFGISKYSLPLSERTIETVYEDENSSSHFRPIHDSMRIYKKLLLHGLGSLIATVIDIVMWLLLTGFLENHSVGKDKLFLMILAACGARVISALFHYFYSFFVVFDREGGAASFFKYVLIAFGVLALQLVAPAGTGIISSNLPTAVFILIKCVVSVIAFPFVFRILHLSVFKKTPDSLKD